MGQVISNLNLTGGRAICNFNEANEEDGGSYKYLMKHRKTIKQGKIQSYLKCTSKEAEWF
jgi:hypothetical protein